LCIHNHLTGFGGFAEQIFESKLSCKSCPAC
jgi:hypothetical protein